MKIFRVFLLAMMLCGTCWAQGIAFAPHLPFGLWRESHRLLDQARIKVRQRKLTEALALFGRSRIQLQILRNRWPRYRRLQIPREIHAIHKEIDSVYRLVAEQGLVEFRGRFYTFEQVRELLDFRRQRTEKWMELLRTQEEVRRIKTERMVEEESKRQLRERQFQQERMMKEQDRLQRESRHMQEENRRNREAVLQKDEQRQRAEEQERRNRQLR